MKIDVRRIVVDHLQTLRNGETGKLSLFDLVLFFVVPLLAGVLSYMASLDVPKDVYNLSVTFFGIFIALLLNMQVALFGIYQRKHYEPDDNRLARQHITQTLDRKLLLSEVNSNISYLILLSTIALLIFLVFFALSWTNTKSTACAVVIYIHFMLSLLMVVKRSHILFYKEYTS